MSDAPLQSMQDLSLAELVSRLAAQRSIDLRGYKHGTLRRRLQRRMQQLNLSRYDDYLRRIDQDPDEVNQLLNTILINVTDFFRDPPAWEILRSEVLPELLRGVGAGGEVFRAWCAGCATGEEPYSLAILLAEYFGDNLPERDIKIYATDTDEDALNAARRAEYPRDHVRRVRPEWRPKYFTGSGNTLRLVRELRRLVIFGRSSLLNDAPISHCNLIICRNLLIYFDLPAQERIFRRLEYALEPGGVLFLGKAESKLTGRQAFRAVNARWRIFEKMAGAAGRGRSARVAEALMADSTRNNAAEEELRLRKLEQRYILDTLDSGLIMLDAGDHVVNHNKGALRIWGIDATTLNGNKLQDTEITRRCPDLPGYLERVRHAGPAETIRHDCWVTVPSEADGRLIAVTLKPMLREDGQRVGTIMHCVDVTSQEKLHRTVEQLESTGEELQSSNEELETANEELQSANEELETTNEELQSTNEELETTNEELQSTNEELETANEELQSLNEELENMNEELEHRTRDLNEYADRYAETLRSMPFPVVLVDPAGTVQLWNAAAQKLLGVSSNSVVGVSLSRLPVSNRVLKAIARRCQIVLQNRRPAVLNGQELKEGSGETLDVHFTPVSRGESNLDGVLVIFGPAKSGNVPAAGRQTRAAGKKRPQTKKPAAKKGSAPARKKSLPRKHR